MTRQKNALSEKKSNEEDTKTEIALMRCKIMQQKKGREKMTTTKKWAEY